MRKDFGRKKKRGNRKDEEDVLKKEIRKGRGEMRVSTWERRKLRKERERGQVRSVADEPVSGGRKELFVHPGLKK